MSMKTEKSVIEMTPFEVVQKVMQLKGHPFGEFKFFNAYDGLKGGKATKNLFEGEVYKYFRAVAMTNIEYQKAVNNRLVKVGEEALFVAKQHKWMDRYINEDGELTSLGYHRADKDLPLNQRRWYFVLYFTSKKQIFESVYYDGKLNEIPYEAIKPYFKDTNSATQSEAGLSQDDQVIYRDIKIESLKEISINGELIKIVA